MEPLQNFILRQNGSINMADATGNPRYSTLISLKVDAELKHDIFQKMMVTDWEHLTEYHTGDLVTRWSSDASNISSGILNWIPNLVIYSFRFLSALAVVLYYDPTFALFALLGIPFSALLSRPLLQRMQKNNEKSAAMNAQMYGFNQEAFSNIQTIKAFDLIYFYTGRLTTLQKEYIQIRMDFQKMSMLTSILMALVGFVVSYSCYGWGIYRVWSYAISYGTMTMFLSLLTPQNGTSSICAGRHAECSILRANINFQSCTMKICGKGNKERIVPFGNITNHYIALYNDLCPYQSEYLLVARHGENLTPNAVKLFMSKIAKSLPFPFSSHKLRHNFATNYCINQYEHNGKVDIYSLMLLMGHEDVETTQRYLHFAQQIIATKLSISHLDKILIS